MSFTATVIADSVCAAGYRLTTFVLRYPRFIHAELMTHRMLSRNASSSRAIPVKRQLANITQDPAQPVEWGLNRPGMQASELLTDAQITEAKRIWAEACGGAVTFSEQLAALNVHKQITNRVAEPFSHITVVVTATEWANFFALRKHPDAQPEFRVLAELMGSAFEASVPEPRLPHEWHLPFVTPRERTLYPTSDLIKLSVARCARTSYNTHDATEPDFVKDVKLHDDLVCKTPLHASPAEHQGTPFHLNKLDLFAYPYDLKWNAKMGGLDAGTPWSANFRGWFQYRQSLPNQNVETFAGAQEPTGVFARGPDVARMMLLLKTFAAAHTTEATPLGTLAQEVYELFPSVDPLFKDDDRA